MTNDELLEIMNDRMTYVAGNLIYIKASYKSLFMRKVGIVQKNGYKYVQIKCKKYLEHRLIFLLFHGYLPKEIDHINRKPLDNRIENLRPCTSSQNKQNRTNQSNTKYSVKGIRQTKSTGHWSVRIKLDGKEISLGTFKTYKDAARARREGEEKYFHHDFIPK